MKQRLAGKGLFLTSAVAVVISGASLWLEWSESRSLPRLSAFLLLLALAAAGAAFALRAARFHILLSQSGVAISPKSTALIQVAGFALSVTPGSLGEFWKLELIRERWGTPLLRTAPVLLVDRLIETCAMVLLTLGAAALLPAFSSRLPWTWPLIPAGLVLLALAVRRGWFSRSGKTIQSWAEQLSLGRRALPHLLNVQGGFSQSLETRGLVAGLGLTAIARLADGLVVLLAAQMLGIGLGLPAAVLVIAVSGLAGGISLLPGGAGAVESTMVGLLMLLGAPFAAALSITLLARLSSLWLWVGIGLVVVLTWQLRRPRQASMPELARTRQ